MDDSAGTPPTLGLQRDSRSLATGVYEGLREMLRDGRLKPGARLRESEIASLMQVSRTPVREALSRLQMRGLVEMSSGGLTVVSLSQPQMIEVYAIRSVLEGAAARFAAENAYDSDLTKLRYVATLFARFEQDPIGYAKINTAFHEAIYEAAHNRYQMRMLEELNDYLAVLPGTTFSLAGRIPVAREEHAQILRAIERRDADAAEKAAREHMSKALEARLELMFSPDRTG